MKYYFTASTKNLEEDSKKYNLIIDFLNHLGHVGLNYVHFSKDDPQRIKYINTVKSGKLKVYNLQTSLIDKSDVLIADTTKESITVGYQIDYALRKKIPVLVIASEKSERKISVMLFNDHYGLLTVKQYSTDKNFKNLKEILSNYMENIMTGKIKFNFFINIDINNYLTKRSEKENKPKSEVLRQIILKEMLDKPL